MPLSSDEFLSDHEFSEFRNGNTAVFRKIYEQYAGIVQYTVTRCGIDPDSCKDIVQDTFIKLYYNAADIKHKRAIKSWLIISARNLTLDVLRKNNRIVLTEDCDMLSGEDDRDMNSDPLLELELKLVGRLIGEICAEVDDDTLSLFYIDGLSAKKISQIKNEAISTVTNRLSRLRKKYRQRILDHINALRDSTY